MLKYSTTEPDDHLDIKLSSSGAGASEPYTVASQFRKTVAKFPERPAMRVKRKVNVSILYF